MSGLPAWEPPVRPTVVLAPHPDDETLGAGALIAMLRAHGVPVSVVAANDGENAYDTSPEQRAQLARTREQEQRRALEILGVPAEQIYRLRLPDSGLMTCIQELTQKLQPHVAEETHLIAPWIGDFHPDHIACAEAAEAVQRQTGCKLTAYFFWTWHRGTPADIAGMQLRRLQATPEALLAKERALRQHASQLEPCKEEGAILPPDLLGPVFWPFEVVLPIVEAVAA